MSQDVENEASTCQTHPSVGLEIARSLQDCCLFQLDEEEAKKLASRVQRLVLKRGELLFRRGDQSDSVYLLISGRMNAVAEQPDGREELIGIVRKGETIGEMGLLSGQPRSLSVRAHRGSTLLRLDNGVIESLPHESLFHFFQLITKRSQATINRFYLRHHEPELMVVIPWTKGGDVSRVVDRIVSHWPEGEPFQVVNGLPDSVQTDTSVRSLDNRKLSVIHIVDGEDRAASMEACENADRIVCVADGSKQGDLSALAQEIASHSDWSSTPVDLVIEHHDEIRGVRQFIDGFSFTRYFNLRRSVTADYQRVARMYAGRAIGLTLSGGGIRGWVHIGAMKAVREFGCPIDAVGGTSAGALMAALWSLTDDTEALVSRFESLVRNVGNPVSLSNFTWPIVSILNGRRGTRSLKKLFGEQRIEDLVESYFCVTCNYGKRGESVHRSGELWKWIRASSAVPGLFPPLVDEGEVHVDGGVVNNLPVDHMRRFLGQGSEILAVDISDASHSDRLYHCPPELTWWDSLMLRRRAKRLGRAVPRLTETFIQSLLMGSQSRVNDNARLADLMIRPDLRSCGMLSTDRNEELIEVGYKAAMEALKTHKWRNWTPC